MLNTRETTSTHTEMPLRTTGVVTGPAPLSLGCPQDAMASSGDLSLVEGQEVSAAKHAWCHRGCPSCWCVTCTQSPDIPELTLLTEERGTRGSPRFSVDPQRATGKGSSRERRAPREHLPRVSPVISTECEGTGLSFPQLLPQSLGSLPSLLPHAQSSQVSCQVCFSVIQTVGRNENMKHVFPFFPLGLP